MSSVFKIEKSVPIPRPGCPHCGRAYRSSKAREQARKYSEVHADLRANLSVPSITYSGETKMERKRAHSEDARAGRL